MFRKKLIWTVVFLGGLAGCATGPRLTPQSHKLVQLRVALGVGYMRQGQLGLARNELAQALAIDPTDAPALSAMAIAEERLREPAKAAHYFRTGLSLHPHDGNLQNNYGAFLCGQGDVKRAIRHFKAALHSPLYATPQIADLNMGVCLMRTPQRKAAIHYFHRAQALAPALAGPYYYLARIRYKGHEWHRAKVDLHQYLQLTRSVQALFLGVRIGRALGDKKLVRFCATRLLGNYGHTPQARIVEAWQRRGQLFGHS